MTTPEHTTPNLNNLAQDAKRTLELNPVDTSFNYVDALYRTDGLQPEHVGNPFIAALPAIPEDRVLAKTLSHLPSFTPAERELPAAMRIQYVGKLSRLFVAVPRVVSIARAIFCMLHQGYEDRAPGSQADRDNRRALYAKQQAGDFAQGRQFTGTRQMSLSLSGSSGAGKTFTVENICAKIPSVIYHPALGRWQVPFAFIEMAHDGKSAHSLATQLAEAFDRLMPDGRFVETFIRKGRSNAEERLFHVLRAAYEYGLGMLIVDEAQNQRSHAGEDPKQQRKKANGVAVATETPLMKLLITASNRAKVPLLFVGTTELGDVVSTRFTKARRTAGNGSACWLPFTRAPEGQAAEFEVLLKILFRYQWTHHVVEYSEEWADLFFEYSQGITDILVKLWRAAQVQAITSGQELLTPEVVKTAFAMEFTSVEFGLTALKNKDRMLLDAISDLLPAEIDVGRYSMGEFGAPVPAVPLGVAMPTGRYAARGDAAAKPGGPRVSGGDTKVVGTRARSPAKPKKEPPSPTPMALDPAKLKATDADAPALGADTAEGFNFARFGRADDAAAAAA